MPVHSLFPFRPREGQQFPDAPVDVLLYGSQTLLWQVDGRVPGEAEADQAAKLAALLSPQNRPTDHIIRFLSILKNGSCKLH